MQRHLPTGTKAHTPPQVNASGKGSRQGPGLGAHAAAVTMSVLAGLVVAMAAVLYMVYAAKLDMRMQAVSAMIHVHCIGTLGVPA